MPSDTFFNKKVLHPKVRCWNGRDKPQWQENLANKVQCQRRWGPLLAEMKGHAGI